MMTTLSMNNCHRDFLWKSLWQFPRELLYCSSLNIFMLYINLLTKIKLGMASVPFVIAVETTTIL
jgi:hypothetical protein